MKILLIGDVHLSDRPPVNATDEYLDDLLDMLRYLSGLSHGFDATIQLGDLFHHKQPSRTSHALVLQTVEVLRPFHNLYVVPGNHDISNDRLDSIEEKQPLGLVYASGVAQYFTGWHENLPVYMIPWQQSWTTDPKILKKAFAEWNERGAQQDRLEPRAKNYVDNVMKMGLSNSLVVTHAPVFPPGTEPPYEYIAAQDIADTMNHEGSFAYGHIHDYHGTWTTDGVNFSNMGALSRGSLTESNLTRPIKVAIWDSETGTFEEKEIPHRPAEEIFKLAEANERKEKALNLDDFLSEVGSTTLDVSTHSSFVDHIKTMNLEDRVRKTAIELLEEQ